MAVSIKKLELTNYRSCRKVAVDLNNKLSVLIGANGSGKSTFMNGILLLSKIAKAQRHFDEDPNNLSSCRLYVEFGIDGKTLPLDALIKYSTNERNSDEVVSALQKWNFSEFTGQNRWISLPMTVQWDLRLFDDTSRLNNSELAFRLKRFNALSGEDDIDLDIVKAVLPIIHKVFTFVIGSTYYGASQFTDPARCPTFFEIEEDRPTRRSLRAGSEHIRFMNELYLVSKEKQAEFEEYLSVVGQEGVQLIENIQYDEIPVPSTVYQVTTGGKVISRATKKMLVVPKFTVRGKVLSPNQLSEGTFKTLAVMFYLITDQSRLLLLEEPEVCVHHGLLQSIVEMIKAFSSRKQIIVSTHSDYVLDAVDPECIYIVKYLKSKGTTIKHISSSMSKRQFESLVKYLSTSGNLGEYWRHGELEK